MDWITFANLFAEEFHGCHIMNECGYLSVGYQAKQRELEWRNNRRTIEQFGKRGRSRVRNGRLEMEFPPHPWREVTYTGYFFGSGDRANRHTCT